MERFKSRVTQIPDIHFLTAIDKEGKQIVASIAMDGIYMSTDGGGTWSKKGTYTQHVNAISINPKNNTLYVVGENNDLSASGMNSIHFEKVELTNGIKVYSIAHSEQGTAYLATSAGLLKTNDFRQFSTIKNASEGIVMVNFSPKDHSSLITINKNGNIHLIKGESI